MLARLAVPFADSSATDLSWGLSPAAGPPLVAISVVVGAVELRLGILGASHQVDARLSGSTICVESLTCQGRARSPVPDMAERDLGHFHYRFRSRIEHMHEDALSLRAEVLRQRLAPDPRALIASFPGHPDAVTGLAARAHGRGVAWRTWHAYPGTGELVRTSTRLVVL